MRNRFICIFFNITFLICLIISKCAGQSITLQTLLEEMSDRYHLTYFPASHSYQLKQFSSYNRRSKTPGDEGWFANNDMSHFLRVENNQGRREFVMLDANGPGVIVRWWMTFYKAQNGTLRVYLDHAPEPVIEGSPADLLRGTLLVEYPFSSSVHQDAPLGEVGRDYDHNFYLPVPFSKHAKITYECDSLVLKYNYGPIPVKEGYYWPDVFYNICYRSYSAQTEISSFTLGDLKTATPLIRKVKQALLDQSIQPESISAFEKILKPGDSLFVRCSGAGSAVGRLSLLVQAENLEQALRSTVLSASFDGIRTIWVPIGEFFGTGYANVNHKTWMNEAQNSGTLVSRWVMPYRNNYELVFINFDKQEIHIDGDVGISEYLWNSNSMYFGAAWHEYRYIKTRDENGSKFDINFINIKGKGVYVGDQITLFNNTYHWWGEGDEKIFVDGELFPSSFGTGSEDYYGYAFGRPEPFSHPFLAQPVGKGNTDWGMTVNMRHRSLDAIPFYNSIQADIELWHWASVTINYALTTYWYVKFPYEINIKPDIPSVQFSVIRSKEDFRNEK